MTDTDISKLISEAEDKLRLLGASGVAYLPVPGSARVIFVADSAIAGVKEEETLSKIAAAMKLSTGESRLSSASTLLSAGSDDISSEIMGEAVAALTGEIEKLSPDSIIAFGSLASHAALAAISPDLPAETEIEIGAEIITAGRPPLMPVYSISDIAANTAQAKRETWTAIQKVMASIGL